MPDTNFEKAFNEAGNDTEARAWPSLEPGILSGELHAPPPFPVQIFGDLEGWIRDVAEAKGAPVDYVAIAFLVACAACIGNARRVSPWGSDGWVEPCILWGGLVGNPSSGKSPAMESITPWIKALEADWARDMPKRLREWETECTLADAKKDAWQGDVKEAAKSGRAAPTLPEDAVKPDEPQSPRLVVGESTVEALISLAAHNPRGLFMVRDELTGLLENFARYSGGSDKPFFLEAYGAKSYSVDRRSRGPLKIDALSISMLGGIQPGRFSDLLGRATDDGFIGRFIWAWPNPIPPYRSTVQVDNNRPQHIFRRLTELMDGSAETIPLTPEADDIFHQWRTENYDSLQGEHGVMQTILGKFPGGVLRVALVLEYLKWADGGDGPPPSQVDWRSVAYAAALLTEYSAPMARRVLGDSAAPPVERNAAMILKKLRQQGLGRFNSRKARRSWGLPGLREARPFNAALDRLEDAGAILPEQATTNGRPKSDYLVNPEILKGGSR